MIDVLYIEEAAAAHPRVEAICARFPRARRIPCGHYGEVFNHRAQNFRLQKRRPSLILALKQNRYVHQAPQGYGIGGRHNFYFSHMLNCLYDCRYCFLQGMHRSAHYVLFVNYEDFQRAIEEQLSGGGVSRPFYFSGYDCDSLAMEPVTGFVKTFIPFFAEHPEAVLELRTKSTQIRALCRGEAIPNCVVAYSFTPEAVSRSLEHKVPALERRIAAMERLQARGWRLGLRFDPLVYHGGYAQGYRRLFEAIFSRVRTDRLHSVSLGPLRLPRYYFDNTVRLYPDEPLFAGPLERNGPMVTYRRDIEGQMIEACSRMLMDYIPGDIFYPCTTDGR